MRHKWKWQTAWVWHPWWIWGYKNEFLHFNLYVIFWSSQLFLYPLTLWSRNVRFKKYFRVEVSFSLSYTGKKTGVLICPNGKQRVIPPIFQAQTWLKVFHLRYETKQKQLSHGVYQVFVSNRLKIFIWKSSWLSVQMMKSFLIQPSHSVWSSSTLQPWFVSHTIS